MQLDVLILGPLEARADGAPIPIGGARLRVLLTRLALDADRSVSITALIDALWGQEPPDGAANALQSLVSRLRRALGDPDLVLGTPGGYAQVALHEHHPDPWVGGMLHLMRGMAAENAGDLATQRRDLQEARRRFAQIGERWGLSATLSALAAMAMADDDTTEAMHLQDQALTLLREINAADDAAQVQMMRAFALARTGAMQEARALMESILESGRRNHSQPSVLMAYLGLADIERKEGDTGASWEYIRASQELTRDHWQGPPQLLAAREITVALLHLAAGNDEAAADRARPALHEAFRLGRMAHDMPVLSRIAVVTACYAAALGDARAAARTLGAAVALRGGTDLGDPDRADVTDSVQAQLSEAEYEEAFASGQALTRYEALEFIAEFLGVD